MVTDPDFLTNVAAMDKATIARRIIEVLQAAGHRAVFAGGCVRDQLRGVAPKDYDIASSATPEQIQVLFKRTVPVGVQFGVILVVEESIPFEVATFRREGAYSDGRRPDSVSFSDLEEDAARRDFTVNGLFLDPKENRVIDCVGGKKDLENRLIRTIGNAESRFLEDHLRMLRAVRFTVQLGFDLEKVTEAAIIKHAPLILRTSSERIRDEFCKIMTSPSPAKGIQLLDRTGLLHFVLPDLETLKGVEQPKEYHPEGDVWIHTMMVLEGLSNAPIELAMGALLHDIAKPKTFVQAVDRIRFHGHDKLGAEMARKICRRLAFPNAQTDVICSLVSEHLKFKDVFQMRQSKLKRFLSIERFDLHLELHRLDCLASHKNLEAYEYCKNALAKIAEQPPLPHKLISGDDLLSLGCSPGKRIGEILRAVEDAILEGNVVTRDEAIRFVKERFLNRGEQS